MSNYLAIDSGGTKTIAIVFNECGKILGVGKSDGGNAVLTDKFAALSSVVQATFQAVEKSRVKKEEIKRGYLFIPGFNDVFEDYKKVVGIDVELKSEIDELRFSELSGNDGIVLLSGTGSFAFAFIDGENYRLGGWGTILGDEGSGYSIGLCGIKKAIEDFDDGKETYLTKMVGDYFGINSIEELRKIIYKDGKARAKIAGLCKEVCNGAVNGNVVCGEILDNACDELAKMAKRIYVKSRSDKTLCVHLAGGLKKAGKIFQDKLIKSIEKVGEGKLHFGDSGIEPVCGGALCLLNDEGIEIKNIIIEE